MVHPIESPVKQGKNGIFLGQRTTVLNHYRHPLAIATRRRVAPAEVENGLQTEARPSSRPNLFRSSRVSTSLVLGGIESLAPYSKYKNERCFGTSCAPTGQLGLASLRRWSAIRARGPRQIQGPDD